MPPQWLLHRGADARLASKALCLCLLTTEATCMRQATLYFTVRHVEKQNCFYNAFGKVITVDTFFSETWHHSPGSRGERLTRK